MTPSEIARSKALEILMDHKELSWLTNHLETIEVQFLKELPKPLRADGSIYGHLLTEGLYVVEHCYVDYADTYIDDDGVIDATGETVEHWLVVIDPLALGIAIESLDDWDKKKFTATTS